VNNFPVAAGRKHVVGLAAASAHTMSELIELRRQMLRFARSLPPGSERNNRRQIASSLRSLFKNKAWLDAHTTTEMIPMQKYFFDMRDGVPMRDQIGIAFNTNAEAITHCKELAQHWRRKPPRRQRP
jgi:hypothetical protein